MEKTWFQYEFGFVNIDEENLYLTNTGNWSEIIGLEEKSKKTGGPNTFGSFATIMFLIVVVGLLGFLFFRNIITPGISIVGLIGIPFFGYKFYEYIKSDIGVKFKIPWSKISKITVTKQEVKLEFLNGDGVSGTEFLSNVSQKGLDLIENIKEEYQV